MKKHPPKPKRKRLRRWLFGIFFAVGAFFLLGSLSVFLFYEADLDKEMDEALFLEAGADNLTRLYYDGSDEEGYQAVEWESERVFVGEICLHTEIEEMPAHLKDAFVAMEDHRFYRHGGIDVFRTAKAAALRLLGKGGFGGSTITQQLVKNIGGESERTVTRKLREMVRARLLEVEHSKKEILEAYLNIVPMSDGCTGVGSASENYFGKRPAELTLAEAASLAAITPAPSRLNPRTHPEAHLKRRNAVLLRMRDLGYITNEECRAAMNTPLSLTEKKIKSDKTSSFYAEEVLRQVKADLLAKGYTENAARALLYGGLHIYTALDKRAQDAADAAFLSNNLQKSYGEDFRAGAVLFSAQTGKMVALVGALGEKSGGMVYNYATDMRRAPGSALKPLALYAPAIEEGYITEATLFDDVPQTFESGKMWPKNSPTVYDGLILAKDALIHSKNTVAVSLYQRLGAEHIYANLKDRFDISGICRRTTDKNGNLCTDLAPAPLALGELSLGVSLFELTRAYLPFCREGKMQEGGAYYWVENAEGVCLLEQDEKQRQALSPQTASVMTHMLSGVLEEGSAKGLSLSELIDTAGKTGTSGGSRDRWFVGYTPYYLLGVWCGYERGGNGVVGTPQLTLFDEIMCPLHKDLSEKEAKKFSVADGLVLCRVCCDSGGLLTDACACDARGERHTEVLLPRAALPISPCHIHKTVFYDEEGKGVVYPFPTEEEAKERGFSKVGLLDIPWRSFPQEVTVSDAEYVYRDPCGTEPSGEDLPFFAGILPDGVYIGKSHDRRPFHARASIILPPNAEQETEPLLPKKQEIVPRRLLPTLPKRKLPRFPFFRF